jgi:hypothetical protein
MNFENLNTCSVQVAAKLSGLSPASFKRTYLYRDFLSLYHQDDGRVLVLVASLARLLGREITDDDVRDANRRLAARRSYQRNYHRQRKD